MKKIFILCTVTLLLWSPFSSFAADDVAASYLQRGAKQVDIVLSISGNPPKAIIVKQQIPSDNSMVSASPRAKGTRNNEATWMFKRINGGQFAISMRFEKDVYPGSLSGEIRFKQQGSGAMIIKRIR
jgi:hypothetical protein